MRTLARVLGGGIIGLLPLTSELGRRAGPYTASKGGLEMPVRARCAGKVVGKMTRPPGPDEAFWRLGAVVLASAAPSFVNLQVVCVDGGVSGVL